MTDDAKVEESPSVPMLDKEGQLSSKLESVLKEVFLRFATASREERDKSGPQDSSQETIFLNSPCLSRDDLNEFAIATNGQAMNDETFQEITEFFDIATIRKEDCLTFKGFLQLYQLQTENDESETYSDLKSWGFTEELEKVGQEISGSEGLATSKTQRI